ncbi:MAG: energy-coupling factor transporter ATPase [Lachnospiraceae bacterium]|jgi:energy-coupling factor transport system ATP-binding protein|nr:energy-coupling factor transporter ATPase [Lachnospiraceae bacterium]
MSIIIDHLCYDYQEGTSLAVKALDDICLTIPDGQFIGVIGHTGSGKSTLIQHLNGLIQPTSGHIYVDGQDIHDKDYDRKKLRAQVGLVFQYPEHQLFETDVFRDVCFGPKNLGLDKKEVQLRAYAALKQVGLDDEYFYLSPFELSGGQKRRAAIAGVLAMQPKVLILDEPTAGLDPKGREEILEQIGLLREEMPDRTIILVSHSMEDVAEYVDRIIVMNQGTILYDGTPTQVFSHYAELEAVGLSAPQVTYMMHTLHEKGWQINAEITTIEEAANEITRAALHRSGTQGTKC